MLRQLNGPQGRCLQHHAHNLLVDRWHSCACAVGAHLSRRARKHALQVVR